jgi:hypothetical protein
MSDEKPSLGLIDEAGDPDFSDVDCEHYFWSRDYGESSCVDEDCLKGLGIENCHFCIFNRSLRK